MDRSKILLETDRLYTRRFTRDDLDRLYSMLYEEPRVRETWAPGNTDPKDVHINRWVRRHVSGDPVFDFRAVILKSTDELIGLMGLQTYDPGEIEKYIEFQNPADHWIYDPDYVECELTYAFGADYWGQGYASEIGRTTIQWGFETVGIGRIVNDVGFENTGSVNLMKRLEMRVEPNMKPADADSPFSAWMVGILDDYSEWKQRNVR